MIFNSKEEALKSREKEIGIKPGDEEFSKHMDKYGFWSNNGKKLRKMGQFFLYEKVINNSYGVDKSLLSYPKLGLYLNSLPCDQTIELEWVDFRRTYEWNIKFKYTYEYNGKQNESTSYLGELETNINRLPIWHDDILIYDIWDSKPNWKQLRQAYEKTWWFFRTDQEKRDIQLDRILGIK